LAHKEVLNRLEDVSPGTKASFLLTFLDRAQARFRTGDAVALQECVRCGQTTTGEVCAFCKLADQVRRAGGAPADATPPEESEPAALRGLVSDLHAATEIHAP
jgi:hypothetical protein